MNKISRVIFYKALCQNQRMFSHYLPSEFACNELWRSRLETDYFKNSFNVANLGIKLKGQLEKNEEISMTDFNLYAHKLHDIDWKNIEFAEGLIRGFNSTQMSIDRLHCTSHAIIRAYLEKREFSRLFDLLEDSMHTHLYLDAMSTCLLIDATAADSLSSRANSEPPFFLSSLTAYSWLALEQLDPQDDGELSQLHQFALRVCLRTCLDRLFFEEDKKGTKTKSLIYQYCNDSTLEAEQNEETTGQQDHGEEDEEEFDEDENVEFVRVRYLRNHNFDNHFDLARRSLISKFSYLASPTSTSQSEDDGEVDRQSIHPIDALGERMRLGKSLFILANQMKETSLTAPVDSKKIDAIATISLLSTGIYPISGCQLEAISERLNSIQETNLRVTLSKLIPMLWSSLPFNLPKKLLKKSNAKLTGCPIVFSHAQIRNLIGQNFPEFSSCNFNATEIDQFKTMLQIEDDEKMSSQSTKSSAEAFLTAQHAVRDTKFAETFEAERKAHILSDSKKKLLDIMNKEELLMNFENRDEISLKAWLAPRSRKDRFSRRKSWGEDLKNVSENEKRRFKSVHNPNEVDNADEEESNVYEANGSENKLTV